MRCPKKSSNAKIARPASARPPVFFADDPRLPLGQKVVTHLQSFILFLNYIDGEIEKRDRQLFNRYLNLFDQAFNIARAKGVFVCAVDRQRAVGKRHATTEHTSSRITSRNVSISARLRR
jgi:hypothetical protein